MKVSNLLVQDMIMPELASHDSESFIREVVEFLKKMGKISRAKELYDKLLQREKLGSTAIGNGFAVPHCKMKGTKSPIVVLAVSRKGIDFFSLDNKPSHIFFLVVSPPENPSLNLQILAAVAHLIRKSKSLKKKIMEAASIPDIMDVIRSEESKLNE